MAATLNFDEILSQMIELSKDIAAGSTEAKAVMKEFADNNKERLELIGQLRAGGVISSAEMDHLLEKEKHMLEAQLNTLEVISKATIQKVVKAVFDFFVMAVEAALPGQG